MSTLGVLKNIKTVAVPEGVYNSIYIQIIPRPVTDCESITDCVTH